MANNRNFKNYKTNKPRAKRSKYTKSEKLAFRMGQEERIKVCVRNDTDSRVVDAYKKGFSGFTPKTNKSLF